MYVGQLAEKGFATIPSVISEGDCDLLLGFLSTLESDAPGTRCLLSHAWCQNLVARLRQDARLAKLIPGDYVAVQCTYFEKSLSRNWLVPVHQDLSIPVTARVSHQALRGWSEKEGALFVQLPVDVLERLLAIRVHLDPCAESDGPLQFIPRSHVLGRIAPETAIQMRQAGPIETCTLERGDGLMMRPLTLHSSSKATGTSQRRVLHVLFAPPELPFGLKWPRTGTVHIPSLRPC